MMMGLQIKDFLGDYKDALSRAQKLDDQIKSDASAISSDYASITALSVRQALAALEITTVKNGDAYDKDEVLVFLKGALPGLILTGRIFT